MLALKDFLLCHKKSTLTAFCGCRILPPHDEGIE
jgi:hypothetical protein